LEWLYLPKAIPLFSGGVLTMKTLISYEMKKIWSGRWKILLLSILGIFAIWMIVIGGTKYGPVRAVLDGRAARVNEETRPYWGQVVTQELHDLAVEKALAYEAEIEMYTLGDTVFTQVSSSPVSDKYGWDSLEYELCNVWTEIANQPL